ncbi:MAG: hypothetical protein CM15mP42_08280 [Methanobacteriota archaeon]|nr:MAG: hypothetical protein CM15mP42_08280 [Euryarchaeota archaeon]
MTAYAAGVLALVVAYMANNAVIVFTKKLFKGP